MIEGAVVEYVAQLTSPVGELTLTATECALTGVYFETARDVGRGMGEGDGETNRDGGRGMGEGDGAAKSVLGRARAQLEEYFAGTRMEFDLPLDLVGTPFQQRVWDLLRAISYGTTTSYGELARRLGDPRATRAVGAANGQNPIPIIVPCHRVVGSRGELTGFGGGIHRKRWLLEHEGALLNLGRT